MEKNKTGVILFWDKQYPHKIMQNFLKPSQILLGLCCPELSNLWSHDIKVINHRLKFYQVELIIRGKFVSL